MENKSSQKSGNHQNAGRKVNNKEIVNSMVNVWKVNRSSNPIDVLGSYRGTPYGYNEIKPEQDVDDL